MYCLTISSNYLWIFSVVTAEVVVKVVAEAVLVVAEAVVVEAEAVVVVEEAVVVH